MAAKRGTRSESRHLPKTPAKKGAAVKARSEGAANRPSSTAPRHLSNATLAGPAPTPSDGARSVRPAGSPTRPPIAAVSPVAAGPTPLERAEGLWEQIVRSKLTHPDPWPYTAKARAWARRAEQIIDDLAIGRTTEGARQALTALTAEVEQDRDFQAARRSF